MPRNKSPAGKPVNSEGDELKAVRLELTVADHRKLRVAAAKEGVSMASFARRLVESALTKIKP